MCLSAVHAFIPVVCVSCCFLPFSSIHDTVSLWQPPKHSEKHKHWVNRQFVGRWWEIYLYASSLLSHHLSKLLYSLSVPLDFFIHLRFAPAVKVTGISCVYSWDMSQVYSLPAAQYSTHSCALNNKPGHLSLLLSHPLPSPPPSSRSHTGTSVWITIRKPTNDWYLLTLLQ